MGGWRACLLLSFFIQQGARLDARDYYDRTPFEAARDLWVNPTLVPVLLAIAAEKSGTPILRGSGSASRIHPARRYVGEAAVSRR